MLFICCLIPLFCAFVEHEHFSCVVVAFVCLLFLNMNIVSCVVVAFVFVVVVGVVVCFRIVRYMRHKSVDGDHCARIRFN